MNSFIALFPLLAVICGALLILILEVFLKKENRNYLAYISLFFLILCFAICFKFWNKGYSYFEGNLLFDNLSLFFTLILTIATSLVILISMKYISMMDTNYGEYYTLILLAFSGMIIMVSSSDLIIIFLGLEILSISSYTLAGLRKDSEKSSEAGIKYFLLGSFASAFLIYGIALIFGAFHSTDLTYIVKQFGTKSGMALFPLAGLSLIVIGFGFKIALVPFHMWTPDVYEGAPTPVTAFFSIGPKIVGFAVLLRILYPYLSGINHSDVLYVSLWIISVLTMAIGNIVALRQTNLKRILAYSSIAHTGYVLIAILAGDNFSLVFYLTVYIFMNIGAFASVIAMTNKNREYVELEDYKGIGFKYPWIGATFSVFLLSLAGIPPLGGFLAKFYIFSSAVKKGLIPLVIIGVMASLISVYYYLRIIVYMYMKEPSHSVEINIENPALFLVLFFCLYGVLQLGLFPGNVLIYIKQAVHSLALF